MSTSTTQSDGADDQPATSSGNKHSQSEGSSQSSYSRRGMLAGLGTVGLSLLGGCGAQKVENQPKSLPTIPSDAWYDESVTGDTSLIEDEVFRIGNEARHEHNAGTLQYNTSLSQIVRYHCWDQIERDYFGHVTPEKKSPGDRVDSAGLGLNTVSENLVRLGQGFGPGREAQIAAFAVDSWLGSVSHREALLDPRYTHVGIGLYVGEDGAGVIGQLFAQDYMEKL